MVYYLNEIELNQLSVWSSQLFRYYSESDALLLSGIADKAQSNAYLDENDIYELLELLPRITSEKEEKISEEHKDVDSDWRGYIEEHQARYRREIDRLHQMLSSLIFLQSAVYRKNIKPEGNPLKKVPIIGQEHGIKTLR